MKKLLTVKEVSDLLQLNERTVLKMLQTSDLPGIRIGAQWRIHPVLLEDWFMRRSEGANTFPEPGQLLFRENHFAWDLPSDSREHILEALVEKLVAAGELLYPELYLAALLERERMLSTGVGNGVALPHARHVVTQTFGRANVVVGRLKTPILYDAVDGQPVDLFFLIASPPATYLETLALISGIVRHRERLEKLRTFVTPGEAAAYLNEQAAAVSAAKALLAQSRSEG